MERSVLSRKMTEHETRANGRWGEIGSNILCGGVADPFRKGGQENLPISGIPTKIVGEGLQIWGLSLALENLPRNIPKIALRFPFST